ncbi:hypothetical protein [Roseateles sp.]|nr:hypothetical protein [Roseateles sp.]
MPITTSSPNSHRVGTLKPGKRWSEVTAIVRSLPLAMYCANSE